MAVGDIMLGDSSHFMGRGVGTAVKAHGADFLFAHVKNLLSQADVFFFNLESPLSSKDGLDFKSRLYRAPSNSSPSLKYGNATIASLANNHVLQHGPTILNETRYTLEKAGIAGAGFSPDGSDDLRAIRVKIGALVISVHCESLIKDCTGEAIDYSKIEDRICQSFSTIPADIHIVSLHWGDEFVPVPSPFQQQLAHRLVERGANLILGHHPHVLQPVEEYRGALIVYSLGNFIFDQRWGPEVETGGVLDVVLSPAIEGWKLHYTRINQRCQPELVPGQKSNPQLSSEKFSPIKPGVTEPQYQALRSTYSRRFRIKMKTELLQHIWKVPVDTWLYLLSTRLRKIRSQPR